MASKKRTASTLTPAEAPVAIIDPTIAEPDATTPDGTPDDSGWYLDQSARLLAAHFGDQIHHHRDYAMLVVRFSSVVLENERLYLLRQLARTAPLATSTSTS